jgi:hypothetical protein
MVPQVKLSKKGTQPGFTVNFMHLVLEDNYPWVWGRIHRGVCVHAMRLNAKNVMYSALQYGYPRS